MKRVRGSVSLPLYVVGRLKRSSLELRLDSDWANSLTLYHGTGNSVHQETFKGVFVSIFDF